MDYATSLDLLLNTRDGNIKREIDLRTTTHQEDVLMINK
ncbi:hypothetical protein LCGC14_3117070, partial [marine sediment metagenome]